MNSFAVTFYEFPLLFMNMQPTKQLWNIAYHTSDILINDFDMLK